MKIPCVWEHNGEDTLLYSNGMIGAFTRGKTKEQALDKMKEEIKSYLTWRGEEIPDSIIPEIVQEKESTLQICDADSDVMFDTEREPLTLEEYDDLKELALKSALDFYRLYEAVPDKNKSGLPKRITFYGDVPRTAHEMYEHTKNVNSYYFGEIGIEVDNEGSIYDCRRKGFEILEQRVDFLKNEVHSGSYDEFWSLRKVLRRFLWHDRIHAKGMYKMAVKTFGSHLVPNIFQF